MPYAAINLTMLKLSSRNATSLTMGEIVVLIMAKRIISENFFPLAFP
jgi:hypothetical protein